MSFLVAMSLFTELFIRRNSPVYCGEDLPPAGQAVALQPDAAGFGHPRRAQNFTKLDNLRCGLGPDLTKLLNLRYGLGGPVLHRFELWSELLERLFSDDAPRSLQSSARKLTIDIVNSDFDRTDLFKHTL